MSTAVRVVDQRAIVIWKNKARQDHPALTFHGAYRSAIAATGVTLLAYCQPIEGGLPEFMWLCPGCGGTNRGVIGGEPVPGWDEPRWQFTGPLDLPTVTPSLGCPAWRTGECPGHYWLRAGSLHQAA